MLRKIALLFAGLFAPAIARADWTPLIASSAFDGIKADVLTVVAGITTIAIIIMGLGLIIRAMGR